MGHLSKRVEPCVSFILGPVWVRSGVITFVSVSKGWSWVYPQHNLSSYKNKKSQNNKVPIWKWLWQYAKEITSHINMLELPLFFFFSFYFFEVDSILTLLILVACHTNNRGKKNHLGPKFQTIFQNIAGIEFSKSVIWFITHIWFNEWSICVCYYPSAAIDMA